MDFIGDMILGIGIMIATVIFFSEPKQDKFYRKRMGKKMRKTNKFLCYKTYI